MEKDRDGCPKIVNLGMAKTDLFYERKKVRLSYLLLRILFLPRDVHVFFQVVGFMIADRIFLQTLSNFHILVISNP